jgi:aspartate aminotransferase
MSNELAQRLAGVKPSPSMAAKLKVDMLRASGRTIVDFTIGEPDFATPPHIVEAGIDALMSGQTKYTASAGIAPLRKAITDKLERDNGLTYSPDQVVVGCGAKHVIYSALAATVNDGDEVIIPAPYWVSYPDMVALHGGKPVIVPCAEQAGFKLGAAALEKAITARTRWLVLNSPNNPTGAVYSCSELESLAAVLIRHPHVWVMTDEIYEHFVYGGARHASIASVEPRLQERTLVVNGMSKAYAMTGWRLGYGAGPASLVKAITLLLTQSISCATSISQAAAVTALQGPQDCVEEAVRVFEKRGQRMADLLNTVPGIRCSQPQGAFYAFASVGGLIGARTASGTTLADDLDVMLFFLDEACVASIDGGSYGMPSYLRMSFATSVDQIEAGCAALAKAVSSLVLPASPIKETTHA